MYVNTTAKTARSSVDFKFTTTLIESAEVQKKFL